MRAAGLLVFLAATAAATERKPLVCNVPPTAAERGDPRVRVAAQRGLDFLARASTQWTQAHRECYGCHVHATTLEGLVIGRKNQYRVDAADMLTMIDAMRTRSNGIHSSTFVTARAFGGVALARYDRIIDGKFSDDLIRVAKKLLESQQPTGAITVDDTRFPVESGVMQATFQAMQAWRQAYARTADDAWLSPIRRAEGYIQTTAASWQQPPAQLQDLSYAILGLSAAGVGRNEAQAARLVRFLLSQQKHDGGWGFRQASDAFATGQALTALRAIGLDEKQPQLSRGIDWLMQHQLQNGSWGGTVSTQGGSAMGEAMWAVLGLVSVDVMTVSVHGLGDGEHVDGVVKIAADAKDNAGGGVAKLELFVDDLPVEAACGGQLAHAWDTRPLKDGKHLVDVVATNVKGQVSRRRFEVYAGRFWLTQVGARFDAATQRTLVSLHDLAPAGTVRFEVWSENGQERVFSTERAGAQGAMTFVWDGIGDDKKPRAKALYRARLSYRDGAGKSLQTEETTFFHDSDEAQKARYGAVSGTLTMAGGAGVAANTDLELLDDRGNVVQRVRTTEQGRYLFKNVNGGKYKVRMRKDGFRSQEQDIKAAPAAAPAEANFSL